ncbi:MAG TPA: hypothetical protein QF753_00495 [Victivallales bacterium]|nr:hypothetical protein [Victivallales bacterium]
MRYTYNEKIWIIILSIISILGFFSFSLMDIFGYVGRDDNFDFSHYNLIRPYMTVRWIVWFIMLCLLFFAIKCLYVAIKRKLNKKKNIATVIITVIFLLIYYVPLSEYILRDLWTLLNFMGVCFMFSIIINTFTEPSAD